MSARYIAQQPRNGRLTPRCDLPGSPFGSKRQAQRAAHKAGIESPKITTVSRRSS
ncbi:hypothetical protein [Chromohalobacter sp. HP20-39]|uniref:hypothetical protein n=1 Tax=Chromohalobacter sp. HP20-39 TaxID=3079306 RepID=UPI00294B8B54|nr:hypothetical protein [Chromohalobacter sp. HP20-39]MDV6318767.1 hypothetical protein [Chromohalobacter sp. HP20-39]